MKKLGTACIVTVLAAAHGCSSSATPPLARDAGAIGSDAALVQPDADAYHPGRPDDWTTVDAGSCAEQVIKTYVWTGPAVPHQGKCTDAQFGELMTACIAFQTQTRAKCDAYRMSASYSKDCERCVTGSGKDDDATSEAPLAVPLVVPITYDGTQYGLFNERACAAAALGLGDVCGNAVTQLTACQVGGCGTCEGSDFDACLDAQASGVCKPQLDAIKVSCLDKIEAGRSTWEPLCKAGKTAFNDVLPIAAKYMCGASE